MSTLREIVKEAGRVFDLVDVVILSFFDSRPHIVLVKDLVLWTDVLEEDHLEMLVR